MKKLLIASFDMEVGGVERSLISMLNNMDYNTYKIDLMLYRHIGDLLDLLPAETNLLAESQTYKTFRLPISEVIKAGNISIALARIVAKVRARLHPAAESGYKQMQYMWTYALPFLPKMEETYDVAISYLWPHYFVAEKVRASTKIAWIHTDYSTVDTDEQVDIKMWEKFHYLIAVSTACKDAFLKKYPTLASKLIVMENITSPAFVRKLAKEDIENPLENDQRFKLVTVARLSHAKGIDQAIKAFKSLKDRGFDQLVWYVVGYGGDEEMLQELIKENNVADSFILLGKQTNPYPYIKAADLYVQPSRYEGKAITVSEAQILGRPVLITNYPTAQSQVKNGVDGIICDLSIDGLADGIEELYNDKALRDRLVDHCKHTDYRNSEELTKLYELI